MLAMTSRYTCGYSVADAILNAVRSRVDEAFSEPGGTLPGLGDWSRRIIMDENLAKTSMALESSDPIEHCHQNLIRELDHEAESGIWLVRGDAAPTELAWLLDEPGISGDLHRLLPALAARQFPEAMAQSGDSVDFVRLVIESRFRRAQLDAATSETAMRFLMGDAGCAEDMTRALRSILYGYHETMLRRLTGLDPELGERAMRDLVVMTSRLFEQAGDYDARQQAIRARAGT